MMKLCPRIVPCGTLLLTLFAFSPQSYSQMSASPAPVLLTVVGENVQAKEELQLGLRDMILGWDEIARLHFLNAVHADADCALAWCGLLVTDSQSDKAGAKQELERILSDDYAGTPAELDLLSSWLRLLNGDSGGAGEEFSERAERFRNDVLSHAWAVILLHGRYDDLSGKALPRQQRALELAERLYAHKPQDAVAAFMRAWVEEAAPAPSDTALAAARFAAQSMPEHPAAQLLLGHLLYRKGELKEAQEVLHQASQLCETMRKNVPCGTDESRELTGYPLELCPLEVRVKLYESTLLWLDGQQKASVLIQKKLLNEAENLEPDLVQAPGAVLLHWEARTLPLRLLMLQPKHPNDAQISAAVKAATPAQTDKNDPLLELRDCLRFCLVARQRAAAGKGAEAVRCVKAAEAALGRLLAAQELCAQKGAYVYSAWTRSCEACQLALLAAKAAAYPDTSDIWLQSFDEAQKPASMLMPPVLPR